VAHVHNDDSAIQNFIQWLSGRDFQIVSDGKFESFGNRSVVLQAAHVAIRLTKDRGVWMIDIAQPFEGGPSIASDIWYEPKIWQSYLDGTLPWTAPTSLEGQIDFVMTRLSEIERALLNPEGIGVRLHQLRKSEAQVRFGSKGKN
jgi:hypothetical protein